MVAGDEEQHVGAGSRHGGRALFDGSQEDSAGRGFGEVGALASGLQAQRGASGHVDRREFFAMILATFLHTIGLGLPLAARAIVSCVYVSLCQGYRTFLEYGEWGFKSCGQKLLSHARSAVLVVLGAARVVHKV